MTLRKIKDIVRNKKGIYLIARYVREINKPDFVQLVKGYYEENKEYTSILMIHYGEKYPNEKVYHIANYIPDNENHYRRCEMGFCAMLRRTLEMLNFSDFFELTPVVEWGIASAYHDTGMDKITKNVFEYYFDPLSKIDYREVYNCKNVIKAHTSQGIYLMEHASGRAESYMIIEDEIKRLGYIYKKYIRPNNYTMKYIEDNLKIILNKGRILGVHVRGTDFNQGIHNHPKVVTTDEYLSVAINMYASGKYDKIFLATEDANVLESFRQEFKDDLLYYKDVFRTKNHFGPHGTPDKRPLHYYRLGLEVLRDVYTLANCDSLLCGLSQVSFAARYVNVALGRTFNEVTVLNNGINGENDSAEAKKCKRRSLKNCRKINCTF